MTLDFRTKNGFRVISFDCKGVLDLNSIHMYIFIKYRSCYIKDTFHQFLSESWPKISEFVSGNILIRMNRRNLTKL